MTEMLYPEEVIGRMYERLQEAKDLLRLHLLNLSSGEKYAVDLRTQEFLDE